MKEHECAVAGCENEGVFPVELAFDALPGDPATTKLYVCPEHRDAFSLNVRGTVVEE